MFGKKLFRYKEFSIPFVVYREGELSRDDFLEIIEEVKEIQNQQHESLLQTLERNDDLKKNHRKLFEALKEVTRLFDEAVDITESALQGNPDEEEDLFEDALETFKKGNLLLADTFYELDEMWERSDLQGLL